MSSNSRTVRHGLRVALTVVCMAVGAVADDLDSGFVFTIADEHGLARPNELVTMSIPLAETHAIGSTTQLVMIDDGDEQIPVQWQVLARWKGAPTDPMRPIRYALAHFRVSLASGQSRNFVVRRRSGAHGPPETPADPIVLKEYSTLWSVKTGPAEFFVGKNGGDLLRMVVADLDGDGVPEPHETIVPYAGSVGSLLVDRFGGLYSAAFDPAATCEVEEAGPLRVVIRLDGKHMPLGAGTIGRDFLRYTTRLTFEAGARHVRVRHTLANDYLDQPLGSIGFGRYLTHLKLASQGGVTVRFGGEQEGAPIAPIALTGMNEATVLQDSSGGPGWNRPGTTFQGYRADVGPFMGLKPEAYRAQAPVATGSHSDGWMDVSDGSRGMLVALRYPWQNYPFGLRCFADGHVIVDQWPAEHDALHWLDDGQRKMHEFVLSFHGAAFDADAEAERLTHPLRPVVPLWFLRNTFAWGDTGLVRDPKLTKAEMKASGDAALALKYEIYDGEGGFGWDNFGETVWAKNTHSTGSPRNKLSFFDKFVVSGAESWFVMNEIFALHSMDLRTYHISGFKRDEHPNAVLTEGMPVWPGTDLLGRNALDPSLSPHRAGIPDKGHGWNGYDSEHMVVDDLYEYYLLTGSPEALDSIEKIGEGILTWPSMVPTKAIISSRIAGWTLRALVKAWIVTGDVRFVQDAKDMITSLETFRGQTPSTVNGLTYHFLAANKYGGQAHNMDSEYDLPWQICVGIYGLALYARETADPIAFTMIHDVSNYILDYGIQTSGPNAGIFKEAIDVKDHQDFNPKPKNDGVNSWISSALAISYTVTSRPEAIQQAQKIFQDNLNVTTFSNDAWHWWHVTGTMLNQ